MSYIGRVEQKASDIRRFNVTGSTSATHTLTWTAPSEQSLIITINGVKQQEDAYSVSGTTLTLTSALVSTDKMEVVGILDIGEAVTPPDDSISTIKIQDDAVTADKLANSINTEIAANTAKITNATHTGDVTGSTALTIANDAVDIAMLSATGTADATTFLRGDNSWVVAGGSNAPAFHVVKADGTQNIGDDTLTKVTFSSTIFDTDSGVDLANNKYVVTSGEGGKYFVYGQVNVYSSVSHSMQESNMKIQINGTQMANAQLSMVANPHGGDTLKTAAILTLAAADYIEIWCHAQVSSGDGIVSGPAGGYNTFFGAFKLDGIA